MMIIKEKGGKGPKKIRTLRRKRDKNSPFFLSFSWRHVGILRPIQEPKIGAKSAH